MSVSYRAAGDLCLWNDLLVSIGLDRAFRKACSVAAAKRKLLPVSKVEAGSSIEQAVCFQMGSCGV